MKSIEHDHVVLDHGTGAKLSRELVELIVSVLGDVYIGEMEDSALLAHGGGQIAVTTDSFVVDPPFFGNGDIGKIAVCGTVNDLAVVGARPLYLTLAMIIETGFPIKSLVRVLESIRDTAREANIQIVAGDTKVVRKGEADNIYLNTTGIGVFDRDPLRMRNVKAGDRVVLSGTIGNHTVHLLSIREGLGFEERVKSDCAPLNQMIESLLITVNTEAIRSIRDVTRGGLSAVLHEYSSMLGKGIDVTETAMPIQMETAMAADMLGINPINCANEGCVCLFVSPDYVDQVVSHLRNHRYGQDACVIGEVLDEDITRVRLIGRDGHAREIEELQGAELPRLC